MGLFLSRYEKFVKELPDVTGKVFVITGKLRMTFWMDESKLVVFVCGCVSNVRVCECASVWVSECECVWLLKIAPKK